MSRVIGVLTGGGDVPGLNPCIKLLVYRAVDEGFKVIGIRRGWGGLLDSNPKDPQSVSRNTLELTKQSVRTVDRTGGTFLHTSRTNPSRVKEPGLPEFLQGRFEKNEDGYYDVTEHVLEVLEHLGIDTLIPIGGDDTLSYAHRMHREGVSVVAIPKTMDNDVSGTDYCIGFSTAMTRSVDYITQLRTSIGSHERIGVVELFGRYSGETSLKAAYLSGADRSIISEVPFDIEKLSQLLLEDRGRSPSNYAVMTISEGAQMKGGDMHEHGPEDAYGHRKLGGIGYVTAQEIKKRTGVNVIYQQLAYLMRSGAPDSLDRMVATNFAALAIDLLQEGESGRLVILRDGRYSHASLEVIARGARCVDVQAFYDEENYRPRFSNVLGKPMFLY
ncbi:MAG TPA: ATP-dependent 6-phosphofructokinase [Acidobacteriota bacterium]|nr:ATP-dependent 6-phosphofructokinase [Acidobacteriota bacterium]